MIVRAKLSIGFPGAIQEDEIEIFDEELEGLGEVQRDSFIMDAVQEWANEKIECWYEEV